MIEYDDERSFEKQGYESIVRLLLQYGADANAEMLDIPVDEESLLERFEDWAWRQYHYNDVICKIRALWTPNGDGANEGTVGAFNNGIYM